MSLRVLVILCSVIICVAAQDWRGNIESYDRWVITRCIRCACWYPWGCAYYREYACWGIIKSYRCMNGWRDNGDGNCRIPICYPNCGTVGVCVRPNECDCRNLAIGPFCQTLTCSRDRPCYPGNCYNNDKCNCTVGFEKENLYSEYGCLKMGPRNLPSVGKSTIIITYIRRTDNKQLYYFLLDGTDDSSLNQLTIWSNQKAFNEMSFEFEAKFDMPEEMPERPIYIYDVKLGIVAANVRLRVINYLNETHPTQKYDFNCPAGVDVSLNPPQLFNCTIRRQEFKTLVEHADTLEVTFEARNGGNRRIIDTTTSSYRPLEQFQGQTATKKVYFKFDFQAPKHCTELGFDSTYTETNCVDATILTVTNEFTKNPIELYWKGWSDDRYGSQVSYYYLELHKLVTNDATYNLTELNPIGPMDNVTVTHMNGLHRAVFTPKEPGMYSILLEVRDLANNSRTARRLVLYDNKSDVEQSSEKSQQLHISSAEKATNFLWQNTDTEDGDTPIEINWTGLFSNKFHSENYLLKPVQQFPVQFKDLEDDGILFAKKFVDPKLDDKEGRRTLNAIPNIRGIVKFEYQFTKLFDQTLPTSNWSATTNLAETQNIVVRMKSGDQLKVWVRATDILGNQKYASTYVTTDFSPPNITNQNDNGTTNLVLNVDDPKIKYNYSSRINFTAFDEQSGVHQIGLDFEITIPEMPTIVVSKIVEANTDKTRHQDRDPACVRSKDSSTCFLKEQSVIFDNCWLMIPSQNFLSSATARVNVLVYNQAMKTSSISFKIPKLTELHGLQEYRGPENIRIENVKPESFRVAWDLPKVKSCYLWSQVVIILFLPKEGGGKDTKMAIVPSTDTYFDFGGLNPKTSYSLKMELGGISIAVKQISTPAEKSGVSAGLVGGVAGGVIALVLIIILVFIILVRLGVIHPQEKVRQVRRAVSTRYRKTFKNSGARYRTKSGTSNPAYVVEGGTTHYDNRQSEFYIYGGMDINVPEITHIDRDRITFKSVIKEGHFARIYLASMKMEKGEKNVVAKTLKENFKPEDEMQMRAKIAFSGTAVGDHPNVLTFIGAVTGNEAMGPFMIYEYCENGTLKDYLVSHKHNVSVEVQESLFRFGLGIAKGMEYLANKGIVHRRLAARNILLTFLNEVKIAGFGPQPDEEMEADSTKQERIPIKWMPPECLSSTRDATEKSDVWSYAVVLWEIFSLGGTPYDTVRSRDLPAKLKKGFRLSKPEQCDDTWYGVMKRCWDFNQAMRPSFTDIRNELDGLFTSSGEEYYYYKR